MDMDLIAEKRELGSRRGTESGSCKAQSELRGGEQEGGDAQASRQARFESRSMLIDWSDEIQEQQPTTILARVPSANGHISEIMPCEDASKSGANANANKRRTEPLTLHEAAREGELKALELALEKGAMPDTTDALLFTALHFAACYGHEDLVQLLISNNADVEATSTHGWRPLHVAARNGQIGVMRMLIQVGAHVDAQDEVRVLPPTLVVFWRVAK